MFNGTILWVLLIWSPMSDQPPAVVPMTSPGACEKARTQLDKGTPFHYRFTACVPLS
jgi:hypothetical protein